MASDEREFIQPPAKHCACRRPVSGSSAGLVKDEVILSARSSFQLCLNQSEGFAEALHRPVVCLFRNKQNAKEPFSNSWVSKGKGKGEAKPLTPTEVQRQARRAKRKNRYEEVIKLHEQGTSQAAIATLVGLSRNTVHSYIHAPAFREQVRPNRHKRKLDPYKEYLNLRLAEGKPSVTELIAENKSKGFEEAIRLFSIISGRSAGILNGVKPISSANTNCLRGFQKTPFGPPGGLALCLQSAQAQVATGLVATGAAAHRR